MFFSSLQVAGDTITWSFRPEIPVIREAGDGHTMEFPGALLSGLPGEPVLPWFPVVLLLPPGEEAVTINVEREEETLIPGFIALQPAGFVQPVSVPPSGENPVNREIYLSASPYPTAGKGTLLTQYLNGYAIAVSTFTPVSYIPASGRLSWYRKITIKIATKPSQRAAEALERITPSDVNQSAIRQFVGNPEAVMSYEPFRISRKNSLSDNDSPLTGYEMLIIAPEIFQNEFGELISLYAAKGMTAVVTTTESIAASGNGWDLPEKIRNYIIAERQTNDIEYVLLAGNPALVPYRGFYCQVQSSSLYTDANIPSDLYYSGLDGSYDANGNHIYGEVADEPDLLPELAVGRFPVSDTASLRNMIHKSIAYQTNPVLGEFNQPLLAGEHLWANPLTLGGPFMDLLIGDHADSGYFTHGIPPDSNDIRKLYDSITPTGGTWQWSADSLRQLINLGPSFIHHLGHASNTSMMRMGISSITNANFAQVNGITHNFTFLITQGCNTGAFDQASCIAARAVSIDNYLAGGVFNSRYGWFNEGSSDGPSQHLQREFVSSLYTDTLPDRHLGGALRVAKVETSPWVTAPGQWEPGALRWCFYCSNAFGDPALEIRIREPEAFTTLTWTGAVDSGWNNPSNWTPQETPTSLHDIIIPAVITSPQVNLTTARCHDRTILPGGKLSLLPGCTLTVFGTTSLEPEP